MPIIIGIMRGWRGDLETVIRDVIARQIVASVMIASGEALVVLILVGTPHGRQAYAYFGTFILGSILAYLIMLIGAALTWRGWAVILTFTLRRRELLGLVLLCLAALPLAATFAYVEYVQEVFGFVVPYGDIAETVRSASPGSLPTSYLALDPWVVGVLLLLTPLPVIAYGAWWLRRIEAAVLAVRRAGDHRALA